jgi:acyl dehydratase
MGVNYGTNKVRFPSPVHVGSDIRLGATLAEFTEIPGGCQAAVDVTIEERGAAKPSCVAQLVFRYYA